MIFSKDLLFIHIPKTGGMSVSDYLLDVLPKPVYYAHPDFDESLAARGVHQIKGKRHETLAEARDVVRTHGFHIQDFPAIVAVLRNPYSLEVSRYSYLQAGHPWDRGPNQRLALTEDFGTFAQLSTYHGGATRAIEHYLLLDGALPERLRVLRFETLVDDIKACLQSLGLPAAGEFPWKNRSPHLDYRAYYTGAAEQAVFDRYRWVFDKGYYERMTSEELELGACEVQKQQLPLEGPVKLVGPALGFGNHNWVERIFRMTLHAQHPTRELALTAVAPAELGETLRVSASVAGQDYEESFPTGEPFQWQIPCNLQAGCQAHLRISSDPSWCPAESGRSNDRRRLAFQLREIRAIPDPGGPLAPGVNPATVQRSAVVPRRSESETCQ